MFPSRLPILTRRIPMSFFQKGFDENWNQRNLFAASIDENQVVIEVASDFARYYHLPEQRVINLDVPVVTFNNARTNGMRLSIGSSNSPFNWISGRFPFIQLDVAVTRIDPTKQIEIGIPLFPDIKLHDFGVTFQFYLMSIGHLTYATIFQSPLLALVPTSLPSVSGGHWNPRQHIIDAVQKQLDGYGFGVGRFITPLLLGAAFDVLDLRHEVATTSVDPVEGYMVIDYVGQEVINDDTVLTTTTGGTPPPPITDPPLFPDELYVPRGDGDVMWKPRHPVPPSITVPKQP